jgi:sirohydrochlorin cobaltochelatase
MVCDYVISNRYMTNRAGKQGLVIFAHGARDPRWAEPFEKLLWRLRARAPSLEMRVASLELLKPDLKSAVAELVACDVTAVRIAPIFFGQGGHVREDLPQLVERLRQEHCDISIECAAPAGEDGGVMEALADYCLAGL